MHDDGRESGERSDEIMRASFVERRKKFSSSTPLCFPLAQRLVEKTTIEPKTIWLILPIFTRLPIAPIRRLKTSNAIPLRCHIEKGDHPLVIWLDLHLEESVYRRRFRRIWSIHNDFLALFSSFLLVVLEIISSGRYIYNKNKSLSCKKFFKL